MRFPYDVTEDLFAIKRVKKTWTDAEIHANKSQRTISLISGGRTIIFRVWNRNQTKWLTQTVDLLVKGFDETAAHIKGKP